MDSLSGLLLGTPGGGDFSDKLGFRGYCSSWDAVTFENTIQEGAVTYENLAVIQPANMSIGDVYCLRTPGKPIIVGRIYNAVVEET